MTEPLSARRLEWLLRARGTDMTAWPDAERRAALDLLRRSKDAQLVLAEALALEEDQPDAVAPDVDRAVFCRMQDAFRRRLAPLPVALRGLSVGVLIACVMAGSYLAYTAPATELDGTGDLFNTAQTVSVAALDQ